MKGKLFLLSIISSILICSNGLASDVVLTVIGPGASSEKSYTEDQIRARPSVVFTTFDPWDNKDRTYKGCSLLSLLESHFKLKNIQLVEIMAKNDYKATITREELSKYPYILSYEMDGQDYAELGEENKGPLAIAVDMGKIEQSDKPRVKNQFVWWIEKITVK